MFASLSPRIESKELWALCGLCEPPLASHIRQGAENNLSQLSISSRVNAASPILTAPLLALVASSEMLDHGRGRDRTFDARFPGFGHRSDLVNKFR